MSSFNTENNFFDNNFIYNVYIRSMTTYDDHYHKDLQYKNKLNIFKVVGFFLNNDAAQDWLLKNGKILTDSFYENYEQGCVFSIIPQKNLSKKLLENEGFEDTFDETSLYFVNGKHSAFVFSEESYKMVLNENFIYVSHDWGNPIPEYIRYIKEDGSIIIGDGGNDEYFEKCLKDYFEDSKIKYRKKYLEFKDRLINLQNFTLKDSNFKNKLLRYNFQK
jgi:hypothetical protein